MTKVVLQAGLEPARFFKQKILSLLCLPIPPPEHIVRAAYMRSALCLAPVARDVLYQVLFAMLKNVVVYIINSL